MRVLSGGRGSRHTHPSPTLSQVPQFIHHLPNRADATVVTGLGLRWALTGPLMTNILGGGGGGPTGFRHLLEHLGPAITAWTKDMNAHAVALDKVWKHKSDALIKGLCT